MKEKFKADRDPQGLNVIELDAEKEVPAVVIDQVLASPFLAEKRMVIVENLLVSKHKDLQKDIFARIEDGKVPETTVLILWEGIDAVKTKDAKALFERLSKERFAQRYDELSGAKLIAWIQSEVAARGGKIAKMAAVYLDTHVKNDMWRLSSLLDQLIAYRNGEEIRVEDLGLFIEESVDDNIFNLIDAIVARNQKQAFSMIQEQYAQGKDPGYIFAMIYRQFNILVKIKDLMEREPGTPADVIAKQLGAHPFVVKKSFTALRTYSREQLERIYADLLQIDRDTKTGRNNQATMIDVFVGRVSAN